MNRSLQELSQIRQWRQEKNIEVERETYHPVSMHDSTIIDQYRFYHIDPRNDPDLSNIHLSKKKRNTEKAIFSIPLDFTKETKTSYKRHDKTEFGFDVRIFLTKNNAPVFPIRK